MHCHSTPPMPGRRPPVYQVPNPLDDMPLWNDVDLPDADPEMPEPPEHGPVPPVILH
jgi:hypothetical protein